MNDSDIEVQEGEEVAGKTIVGGRPLRRREMKMSIPAGIEKTLYKASIDPGFKARLFEDRFGAVESCGIKLTDLERRMLRSIPDSRLSTIIGQIRPAQHGQRKFMKAVATAVVTLAAGTGAVILDGCNLPVGGAVAEPPDVTTDAVDASASADAVDTSLLIETGEAVTRGVEPDEIEILTAPPAPGGIVPDPTDNVVIDTEEMSTGGANPDLPEKLPKPPGKEK